MSEQPTRREPLSHYCDWDEPGRHRVMSICRVLMKRTEHSNEPTCPNCQAGLKRRNDDASAP